MWHRRPRLCIVEARVIALAIAAFITGLLHAAGPDHLAAVAGLAARRHARPWLVGVAWGSGHAAGVTLLGGAALFVGAIIPVHLLSSAAESLVGFVLIFLGLRTLAEWRSEDQVGEAARHHTGKHAHSPTRPAIQTAAGTGLLHGLAGSSHLVGAIPALLLPQGSAIVYLLCFGLGAIAGMSCAAAGLGLIFRNTARARLGSRLRVAAGLAAVVVGVWWTTTAR
jgi:hypothetical protein